MPRPDLSRVPEYFHKYINQVSENDLLTALSEEATSSIDFLGRIPVEKHNYRYAAGKWTIKEVVQHIMDTERVFNYRALCFARKDTTPLPGFDENIFAENAGADERNWDDLVEEFTCLRQSTLLLYRSFTNDQLEQAGVSNNKSNYVLGWGYITAGHCKHHITIIKERYL